MADFHGFFYTQKEQGLKGLKLSRTLAVAMEEIWNSPFAVLTHETYWRKLVRYMMTHAPQGYVAWHGVSHWVVGNVPRIIGRTSESEVGVNVLQFHRDRTFAYGWFTRGLEEFGEEDDPVYDLVFTPWDWQLSGVGDEEMFALDAGQTAHLRENMAWTDPLHAELEVKWPSEAHWE